MKKEGSRNDKELKGGRKKEGKRMEGLRRGEFTLGLNSL